MYIIVFYIFLGFNQSINLWAIFFSSGKLYVNLIYFRWRACLTFILDRSMTRKYWQFHLWSAKIANHGSLRMIYDPYHFLTSHSRPVIWITFALMIRICDLDQIFPNSAYSSVLIYYPIMLMNLKIYQPCFCEVGNYHMYQFYFCYDSSNVDFLWRIVHKFNKFPVIISWCKNSL